jgi:hypothetical protein
MWHMTEVYIQFSERIRHTVGAWGRMHHSQNQLCCKKDLRYYLQLTRTAIP